MNALLVSFAADSSGGAGKQLPQHSTNSERTLLCTGDFTGIAQVEVQLSANGSAPWVSIPDLAFTANGVQNVAISGGYFVRGYVSGGSGSHSINLYLGGV
mgnify:CR=1 FL=1|tara:strand:+ start:2153 stop:2452 length:300 start_codon:yes stop_codon:yes gene_type:complete